MHTLISTDLSEWAAHRRAVVLAVSRQVPGADPELATSRGLEELCREVVIQGAVDRPVDYWHHAAVDAATEASTRAARTARDMARARTPRSDAPAPPAEPRAAGPRSAKDRPATDQPAEHRPGEGPTGGERTAEAPARRELPPSIRPAARTVEVPRPDTAIDLAVCRTTRGAMHDYIGHRLLPGRRQELEDHLVDCAECTRAFVDIRESHWMLRAAAPVVLLGTLSVTASSVAAEVQ